MVLNQDIFKRLEEARKPEQLSHKKKQILYFVGATACGKSTKVRKLKHAFRENYQYITQDEIMSSMLDQENVYNKNLFYLQTLWDLLLAAVKQAKKTNQNTIFVDGHPLLSVLCSQALLNVHGEGTITRKEVDNLNKKQVEILDSIKEKNLLKEFDQIIYYINLPQELNIELFQNRQECIEIEENDKKELIALRETIHSQIFDLAEKYYNTKVVEVKSLIGLDIIHTYLLGAGSC